MTPADESGDLGFAFQVRKSGEIMISRDGRAVTTLRGPAARDFLTAVANADPQQVMARFTGKYRHGNERLAFRSRRDRG